METLETIKLDKMQELARYRQRPDAKPYVINKLKEQIAALVARFQSVVEANGTVSEVNEWGKRRLAYPINDLMEGYYVLMTFNAAAAIPAELDRIFRITDGVMRSLIVCKDQ